MIKTIKSISLILLVFFLHSCSIDDDNTITAEIDSRDYRIAQAIEYDLSYDVIRTTDFTYDGEGKLIRLKLINPDVFPPTERLEVVFNYDQGLLVSAVVDDSPIFSYDYNNEGLVSSVSYIDIFGNPGEKTYVYATDGLSYTITENGCETIFNLDDSNNITNLIVDESCNFLLETNSEFSYDSNKNPYYHLLPEAWVFFLDRGLSAQIGSNNTVSLVSNGEVIASNTEYEYNDMGYPIKYKFDNFYLGESVWSVNHEIIYEAVEL